LAAGLERYLLDALKQLGGEIKLVPGARVASAAIALAKRDGVDFQSVLFHTKQKFGVLAREVAKTDNLRLIDRAGSDFLIGFEGANEEIKSSRGGPASPSIRKDFYAAFSHVSQSELYYLPDKDLIVALDAAPIGSIPVPSPTYNEVWHLREQFAESLQDKQKEAVLLTAVRSPNRSFRVFADLVRMYDLSEDWHAYQYDQLRAIITRWAEKAGLPVRDNWFSQKSARPTVTGANAATTLAALLASLTDDELARVLIPADVIQAALARLEARS